jgi:hypothetical protein
MPAKQIGEAVVRHGPLPCGICGEPVAEMTYAGLHWVHRDDCPLPVHPTCAARVQRQEGSA